MNLLNLFATLSLNKSDYDKGIKDAKKEGNNLKNSTIKNNKASSKSYLAVATAVVAVITAVAKLTNETINYGDSIDKQSQKLNMSNEMYQKWSLALQMAGADISSLTTGMRTFNTILVNASEGQADAILMLEKLGLSYQDFAGLSVEEIFYKVVEALQSMEEGTEKTKLAQELFGRAGQELLPLLNQEQGSIEELFKKFEDLGLIMDDTAVSKSAELNDALFLIQEQFKALGREIGTGLYPLVEGLIDMFYKFKDYLQEKGIFEKIENVGKSLKVVWEKLQPALEVVFDLVKNNIDYGLTQLGRLFDLINDILNLDFNKLWRDIKQGFKDMVNWVIDGINAMIRGLNKISFDLPDWLGGYHIGIDIPLIPRLQRGKDFIPSDMYPAYLDYGERVLTRKENEKYSALGGIDGISALVNGMRGSTYNNVKKDGDIIVNVRIGDKEIKDYVYNIVNSAMKQKGLKSLNKVGGYYD